MKNLTVLEAVCGMMEKLISPKRLATAQLLTFVTGPLGPVARLGLGWLKSRDLEPGEIIETAG